MLALKERANELKDIAYYAADSRLTAEPDGKRYDWSAMIQRFKELGRKLTDEEAEQYRIK